MKDKKHEIFGGKVVLDIPGMTAEQAKQWEKDIAKKMVDMGGKVPK